MFRHSQARRSAPPGTWRGYRVFVPGPGAVPSPADGRAVGSLAEEFAPAPGRQFAPAMAAPADGKPGDWYRLEIIARGNAIKVFVNSTQTVDCVLNDPWFREGSFAFPVGVGGSVAVRNVEVKEFAEK